MGCEAPRLATGGADGFPESPEPFSLIGGPLHQLGRRLGLVRGTNTVAVGLVLGGGIYMGRAERYVTEFEAMDRDNSAPGEPLPGTQTSSRWRTWPTLSAS